MSGREVSRNQLPRQILASSLATASERDKPAGILSDFRLVFMGHWLCVLTLGQSVVS